MFNGGGGVRSIEGVVQDVHCHAHKNMTTCKKNFGFCCSLSRLVVLPAPFCVFIICECLKEVRKSQ